jgi:two-component system, OmpR family, sensor histidine kinase VicK
LTTTPPPPPSSSSDTNTERTEVLEDEQNVVNTVLRFTSNTKIRIDACIDYSRPSLAIEIGELKKAFLDARSRGVKLRYITEITENNVGYCRELMKMVDEVRHIDGIKGSFYLNETEYIAPATFHAKGRPASQIIRSNVKEIVEHHQHFVFDSLWARAIPAEQRLKEIEEGGGIPHLDETKVSENQDEIFQKIKDFIETDHTDKIRLMLQPIILKQAKDAERQSELIKQLQSQIKQLQKEVSEIHKNMAKSGAN